MRTRTPKEAMQEGVNIRDWFVMPEANSVARRHEVWTLLGWYHQKVVKPQLGFTGGLRRLWWQLTGQSYKLVSPWEEIHRVVELKRTRRARLAEHEAAAHVEETTRTGNPALEA